MSGVFDRIEKRKAFPIDVNGEVMHVAEPTMNQIDRIQRLKSNQATGLALGLCLVDEGGTRLFNPEPDQTDAAFADRILVEASDCTVSAIRTLSEGILKLVKPVDQESLAKN